jgi:hypothetical protein
MIGISPRFHPVTARISTGDAARLLGRDRRLVARWIAGTTPIPSSVWPRLAEIASK